MTAAVDVPPQETDGSGRPREDWGGAREPMVPKSKLLQTLWGDELAYERLLERKPVPQSLAVHLRPASQGEALGGTTTIQVLEAKQQGETSKGLRSRFRTLAERWRMETALLSSLPQKVLHPSYQRIIGLGPRAIPLVLEELRRQSDHWMWALSALSGEDPASGTETMDDARDKWLEWGRLHGYIE